MLSVGVVAYGLEIYVDRLPAAIVTLAVGVTAFAALGLALAAISPTGDTAPAVANATLLPVAFISAGGQVRQQVTETTVEESAQVARDVDRTLPTLAVVGHVVTLRSRLAWFTGRPQTDAEASEIGVSDVDS